VTKPPTSAPIYAYTLGDALYLNITSGCTLACVFCPKISDDDFTVGPWDLRLDRNPDVEEVWQAVLKAGLAGRSEVVFTGYGESTRRHDVLMELTRRLNAAGVKRVRIDTEGLASLREGRDVVPELAAAGVDAVSVSLNAADAATYARICPSRFGEAAYPAVQAFIRSAVRHLPEVTATAVGVPEVSETACRAVAEELGARFKWRPFGQMGRLPPPQSGAGGVVERAKS
jgi:TatD family-associated radical SAM protein